VEYKLNEVKNLIEIFEWYKIENKIKNTVGNKYLSGKIDERGLFDFDDLYLFCLKCKT
jgi:hypothetical protein